MAGVHLSRSDENVAEIDALAARLGGRVGLDGVLADLDRQARRSRLGRLLGRAVDEAWTWEERDNRDHRWWPQGISTSADASETEDVAGRRLLVTTWYSHQVDGVSHGSRVTFVDLDTLRYRHVLLRDAASMEPAARPRRRTRLVWPLPARRGHRARVPHLPGRRRDAERPATATTTCCRCGSPTAPTPTTGHDRLRYSFLSLDRSASPTLVAGEYGRGSDTTRLARFDLDAESALPRPGDDGFARPVALDEGGVVQMQGAVVARGRYHVTVSHGPWRPGSVYVGQPGDFTAYPLAVPMGPEDLAYWPSTDRLWSVSEHPRRRWIFSMRRSWFD